MVVINGDTGIDTIQYGKVVDADLNLSAKPMFSAYQSVSQSVPATTWTKVNLQTKEFDLTNAFDTTTMRFTPQKAGYYSISASSAIAPASAAYGAIYKNGVKFKTIFGVVSNAGSAAGSCIIYMNGTTDYVEKWIYTGAAISLSANNSDTFFQAHYISTGV